MFEDSLAVDDGAKVFNVDSATIRLLCGEGKLPSVRLGNHFDCGARDTSKKDEASTTTDRIANHLTLTYSLDADRMTISSYAKMEQR